MLPLVLLLVLPLVFLLIFPLVLLLVLLLVLVLVILLVLCSRLWCSSLSFSSCYRVALEVLPINSSTNL